MYLGDIIYQVIVLGGLVTFLSVLGYLFFKKTKKN